MTGNTPASILPELRREFPGWDIDFIRGYALPWEARQRRHRPHGGIAHLVAVDAEYLRELLTAAIAINSRHVQP